MLMEYLPLYNEQQLRRHEVRPGITGWAQVNGRNAISWEKKFEFDVWYVDHASLTLDFKILLMTIWKVMETNTTLTKSARQLSRNSERHLSVIGGSRCKWLCIMQDTLLR